MLTEFCLDELCHAYWLPLTRTLLINHTSLTIYIKVRLKSSSASFWKPLSRFYCLTQVEFWCSSPRSYKVFDSDRGNSLFWNSATIERFIVGLIPTAVISFDCNKIIIRILHTIHRYFQSILSIISFLFAFHYIC